MSTYFDTSAVVPLITAEATTPRCRELWRESVSVVSSSLVIVELHAALARAHRMGRIDDRGLAQALEQGGLRLRQLTTIPASPPVVEHAARLAVAHGLRGYDAVHLASALLAGPGAMLFVSGDRALLAAASAEGLATAAIQDIAP